MFASGKLLMRGKKSVQILGAATWNVADSGSFKIDNYGFSSNPTYGVHGTLTPISFPPAEGNITRLYNQRQILKPSGAVNSNAVFLDVTGAVVVPPNNPWTNMHILRPDNTVKTLARASATTGTAGTARYWQWLLAYLGTDQIIFDSGNHIITFD